MILSDTQILKEMDKGNIVIKPFDKKNLGSNSYDVHLGKYLATYEKYPLDAKKHNTVTHFEIPEEGFVLQPGTLYLGVTEEYTETHKHVPLLEGKSSTGRLGIFIHSTAGLGDVGYCNTWTLQITTNQPVRIYPGMPIGQIVYFKVEGIVETIYSKKSSAKYINRITKPVESMMWKNFK